MASGTLGQAALVAATNTSIYTVPAATFTVLHVSAINRGTSVATVRLALASSSTPTNAEYIEYDAQIGPNGVLERTGIIMDQGKILVAYANNDNVSVCAYGVETSTV